MVTSSMLATGCKAEEINLAKALEAELSQTLDAKKPLWFDFFADTGDGQAGTYSVACLCLSDLWIDKLPEPRSPVRLRKGGGDSDRLPRGRFLFIGGDTAYHIADYETLYQRLTLPFQWAADDLELNPEEPKGLVFGLPGNHDYYDSLDGFNRQFRKPATEDAPWSKGSSTSTAQLHLTGFKRRQNASWFCLKLPGGWELWALDAQGGVPDRRQIEFVRKRLGKDGSPMPKKLIVATPEPMIVFGRYSKSHGNLKSSFEEQKIKGFPQCWPKLATDRVLLELSGDVHHYVRHWGRFPDELREKWSTHKAEHTLDQSDEQHAELRHWRTEDGGANGCEDPGKNYASVVSGGGGAFLHPSHTYKGKVSQNALYPDRITSHRETMWQLLNPWNTFRGGYVWLFGVLIAAIVYSAATIVPSSRAAVERLLAMFGFTQSLQPASEWGLLSRLAPSFESASGGLGSFMLLAWPTVFLAVLVAAIYFQRERAARLRALPAGEWPRTPDLAAPILAALLGTSLLFEYWILPDSQRAHPFIANAWFLLYLFAAGAVLAWSARYRDDLVAAGKMNEDLQSAYHWLLWLTSALGLGLASLGVVRYGTNPVAAVVSDLLFHCVILLLVPGLALTAMFHAGRLHGHGGKFGFLALGLWHGLLQLTIPFLAACFGELGEIMVGLLVLVLVNVAAGTAAWIGWLDPFGRPWKRHLVTTVWFTLGGFLLWLFQPDQLLGGDDMKLIFTFSGTDVRLVVACLAGLVFSCFWLGWYFAVSLLYHGHNNEAGGGARLERYRHFIRFKLTKDTLTGYVIGLDRTDRHPSRLAPKLVDVFELRVEKDGSRPREAE